MLCIVIMGPSLNEVREQIKLSIGQADLVELRLDHFDNRHPEILKALLKEFSIPMIFTLRPQSQGGNYRLSEETRMTEIKSLASCAPAYLDLEAHLPEIFLSEMAQEFPNTKLIISYHDFDKSLEDIENFVDSMPQIRGAFYKIATMAHSTADALRLMIQAKKSQNLIAISMGEQGEMSRILAPAFKCKILYTSLDDKKVLAPGQLPVQSLLDTYRVKSIHANTRLYGLVGDPVTGSIGHLTNNAVMRELNLDAVYVKMKVQPKDLSMTLPLLKSMGFRGLAVTMPLKVEMIPLLDDMDSDAKAIGAVSFVHIEKGRLVGYNKDGYGALESLEKLGPVRQKKMIILGAGGAARAIAYEARKRGAHVVILNRTKDKAQQLAEEFNCEGDSLDQMQKYYESGYKIIINCLPYHLPHLPINPQYFHKDAIAMDITSKPMNTLFLQAAQAAGCRVVHGYQMFIRQTMKQFEVWFKGQLDSDKVFDVLNYTAQTALRDL